MPRLRPVPAHDATPSSGRSQARSSDRAPRRLPEPVVAGGYARSPAEEEPDDYTIVLPYAIRPPRPARQAVAQAGLWAAVALGCVTGIVGLARSSQQAPPAEPAGDGDAVPAAVGGVAERAVEAWLTRPADDELLAELFVEAPLVADNEAGGVEVGSVTAVSGERLAEGYWKVSVAAEVMEPTVERTADEEDEEDEDAAGSEDATGEQDGGEQDGGEDLYAADEGSAGSVPGDGSDEAGGTGDEAAETGAEASGTGDKEGGEAGTTWNIEVAVVGDDQGRLAALTTPAVLAAFPELGATWQPAQPSGDTFDPDDLLHATVASFLDALLTGGADPRRYLAPGVELEVAEVAPFAVVEVDSVAAKEEGEENLRVWVAATATSPTGAELPVAYELLVGPRVDRWEVLGVTSQLSASAEQPEDAPADAAGD